jgi:hypothetical protein
VDKGRVWCITGNGTCLNKSVYIDPAPGPTPSIDSSITSAVRVFPNPVRGQAIVQWHFASVNDKSTIQITDMQGRRVMTVVPGSNAPGMATIDLSSLQDGIFMIAIYQNNKITAVGKLIRIR